MKSLFILGRNLKLSEAEIFSYFEKEEVKAKVNKFRNNILILESEEFDIDKAMKRLGGTIAIGRVLASGNKKDIEDFIDKNEIVFIDKNKFEYSFIGNDEIVDAIKNKFKREKLKARYQRLGGKVEFQDGDSAEGSPSKFKDIVYFYLNNDFGVIENKTNTQENKKRDMEKPVRRSSLSISPRLAKILINLSQVKEGELLLDPFCGIGTILQEALLQNINVTGVDYDGKAVFNANRNMNWLKKNYKIKASYDIFNEDSTKIRLRGISGIATEPSLGKLLTYIPKLEDAQIIVSRFENLMINVLKNLKYSLKLNSRIAFTSPLIKTREGRLGARIDRICQIARLKLERGPFPEFRENIVGREIYVLRNVY